VSAGAAIAPGRLVYGMQLPVQSQSGLYVEPWEQGAGPEALRRIAAKADATDFFYVAVCDHVVIPSERVPAMGSTWYDTVATLGHLSALTTRVRLLSHVVVAPYRHPLVVAKAFATLDALSSGRAILGIGAGHVEGEFAALGVDFARRGAATDAAIALIRRAFAEAELELAGGSLRVALAPRPVQRGGVPIWVGGSSRAAIRRAARQGDGWLPQGTPRDELPAQIALLREERKRAQGDAPIAIGANAEPLYVGRPGWDVGPRTLQGPAEHIALRLGAFAAMGVSHVQLRFRARSEAELLDQMDAFHAEVAPRIPA
jgi:probable F420-dependent oxidoreductase